DTDSFTFRSSSGKCLIHDIDDYVVFDETEHQKIWGRLISIDPFFYSSHRNIKICDKASGSCFQNLEMMTINMRSAVLWYPNGNGYKIRFPDETMISSGVTTTNDVLKALFAIDRDSTQLGCHLFKDWPSQVIVEQRGQIRLTCP
ncbi:MAG: hypothetical protein AAF203_09100, partial [Pseudomonadota bacterium]